VVASCLLQAPAVAALSQLSFRAETLDFGDVHLEQVAIRLSPASRFEASFDRMTGPGDTWLRDGLAVSGALEELSASADRLAVRGTVEAKGIRASLSIDERDAELLVKLRTVDQPLTALATWPGLPEASGWLTEGRFDSDIQFRKREQGAPAASGRFQVRGLAFDSPGGRYAGEGLQLEVSGEWPDIERELMTIEGALRDGELLVDDFYRDFASAGLDLGAEIAWSAGMLDVTRLMVSDGDALAIEARARVDLGESRAGEDAGWLLEVGRLELDFPAAYERYLEAMGAAWTLDGLEVTGRLSWSGEWATGNLISGDLAIDDLSIVDAQRQRFAFTGLEARLRPGDHTYDSRLNWRGLLFGRINLGAGSATLDSEPGTLALLEPLTLDVLDGTVELRALKVLLPGGRADMAGEPDVLLRARIHELDMAQLTAALGWPSFSGKISGEIPGVSLESGVLGVDGEIRIDVFGGRIALQNLSMERPFGVLPSLAADMAVSDLDLEQLTQTFSFGRIAGRLDGYVRDLRMLDWRPVAFDAWLGTPERQVGSKDISRQAVNRLTTIGGGSATAALTGPIMRMFSNFSYRRLGLGCRLQNNVCLLRGLSEDEASVLILEGSGVPKITIRAFNRNIDWPQMVSNLLAISADNPVQIGGTPDS
jgi:hypothetical protein